MLHAVANPNRQTASAHVPPHASRTPQVDLALIAAPPEAAASHLGNHTVAIEGKRGAAPRSRDLMRQALAQLSPRGRDAMLSREISYFALLPHIATDRRASGSGRDGGSRAVGTAAAIHFIFTFYDNLPPLVIFTDDSCAAPTTARLPLSHCAFMRGAASAYIPALAAEAAAEKLPPASMNVSDGGTPTGVRASAWQQPPNCLCELGSRGRGLPATEGLPPRGIAAWEHWCAPP